MTPSSRPILALFLKQCPEEERHRLLLGLSPQENQALGLCPEVTAEQVQDDDEPLRFLQLIHPSWIVPFLRTLSQTEIGFFVACLPQEQAAILSKELLHHPQYLQLSVIGITFLHTTLISYLTTEAENVLPISCLPSSPLNPLLSLSFSQLVELVDLLGMHDVSVEIKTIIDKNKLLQIYNALSRKQLQYMKTLIQHYESMTFTPISLAHWKGDTAQLQTLIRHRGCHRLARALLEEHSSLIWYVLHRLDIETAFLIRKLSGESNSDSVTHALKEQVTALIHSVEQHHG